MAWNFKQDSSAAKSYILLAVLLVISLVCVTMYSREGTSGFLHNLQATVSGASAPVKSVSGALSSAESSTSDAISDATADANTLSGLRTQNEQLRATIAELEEYRQEAERLQDLLDLKDSYNAEGVSARVLSRSSDSWNQMVTIDKGTNDGVRAGLPVMGPSGLLGQVVSTSASTSDIRLITDPQSGVSVMIQSSRKEGILKGSFDGLLYLQNIDDDAEVKTGDVVITSGLGGGYFSGIMVGTVVKVEGETGSTTRKIVVSPNSSTDPLEEVLVVTSMSSTSDSNTSSSTTSSSSSSSTSNSSSAASSSNSNGN